MIITDTHILATWQTTYFYQVGLQSQAQPWCLAKEKIVCGFEQQHGIDYEEI